jgi:hypothetical protein
LVVVDAAIELQEPPPDWISRRYPVIAEPPLEKGAVQETTAWALLAVTDTEAGAAGTATGVRALEALEVLPVPALFVAVTVNVYDVPFVRPVTAHDVEAVVHVAPPGLARTE